MVVQCLHVHPAFHEPATGQDPSVAKELRWADPLGEPIGGTAGADRAGGNPSPDQRDREGRIHDDGPAGIQNRHSSRQRLTMAKKNSPKPTTIMVEMSKEEYDMLYRFAHRAGASVSQVVHLGTLRVINKINRGDYAPDILNKFPSGSRPVHS